MTAALGSRQQLQTAGGVRESRELVSPLDAASSQHGSRPHSDSKAAQLA
jgi:hypothetical protein